VILSFFAFFGRKHFPKKVFSFRKASFTRKRNNTHVSFRQRMKKLEVLIRAGKRNGVLEKYVAYCQISNYNSIWYKMAKYVVFMLFCIIIL